MNRSDGVRSRIGPCAAGTRFGVRPASAAPIVAPPTCTMVDCADIAPHDVVMPETICAAPAIGPGRCDLEPGEIDDAYTWTGRYSEPTERNCWQAIELARGTTMVAVGCFGRPTAVLDIDDLSCKEYEFTYGQELAEFELR